MKKSTEYINFWKSAFKQLKSLKDYPALFFAALIVLIVIPLLIFYPPEKILLPLSLFIVLAFFALLVHLIKDYFSILKLRAIPAGIASTIAAQKTQIEFAVNVSKPDTRSSYKFDKPIMFSTFWEQAEDEMVTIEGTLSRFAPLLSDLIS